MQAVSLGISKIAFTEHCDSNPIDLCYGMFNLDFCRSEIESAREAFDGKLKIMSGVEFGEPHMFPDLIEEAKGWDLDVLLGSVHWIGNTIVAVDGFNTSGMDTLYQRYFDEVLKAVEFGGFDVMAHFDLVKRFGVKYAGPFDMRKYKDHIAAILQTMIAKGIALEVNTSGLRQPCQETMPGLDTLRLYRELGGELITIGSDSHRIQQLGFGLREGMDLIRQAGFTAITTYEKRQPCFVPLDI